MPTLLDNYKVLIYNGQLDIILGPPLTEKFLRTIEWSGAEVYRQAKRKIWKLNDNVVGYERDAKNFRQVIVLAAGHLVPLDQPASAFNMIDRFIQGI